MSIAHRGILHSCGELQGLQALKKLNLYIVKITKKNETGKIICQTICSSVQQIFRDGLLCARQISQPWKIPC